MIPQEVLDKTRECLKESQNPLFFYDDDCDGTCSYLLLKKFVNKGKGIIVKTTPKIDINFYRKVSELNPDLIVVLDLAKMSQEFVEKTKIPIIWIDHHPLQKYKGVHYLNPLKYDKKDNRPTSYWAYKVVKQNLWIAMAGCIADYYIPDFTKDFIKKYPDLLDYIPKKINEKVYETKLGELIKIIDFNLKGKSGEVKKSISVLLKIEDPLEILENKTPRAKLLNKKYQKINKMYQKLLGKSLQDVKKQDPFIFFSYLGNKMALSSELSSNLQHKFPDKIIIICREKEEEIIVSLRSVKYPIRDALTKSLEGLTKSTGGGHLHACGAIIKKQYFQIFLDRFKENMIETIKD